MYSLKAEHGHECSHQEPGWSSGYRRETRPWAGGAPSPTDRASRLNEGGAGWRSCPASQAWHWAFTFKCEKHGCSRAVRTRGGWEDGRMGGWIASSPSWCSRTTISTVGCVRSGVHDGPHTPSHLPGRRDGVSDFVHLSIMVSGSALHTVGLHKCLMSERRHMLLHQGIWQTCSGSLCGHLCS